MDRDLRVDRLRLATTRAVEYARRFVWNELPDECRYLVFRGQAPLELEDVVAFLWREGKIPEWVNMSVNAADEMFTYIEVNACG